MQALDSLSYEEIASRLGIPTNTVGTRLLRARQTLRTMLEASENGVSSSADVTDR